MRALTIATTSRHKQAELQAIFGRVGVELELPRNLPDVVEDQDTFAKNAALKAETIARYLGRPVLADDSGLEVFALGGAPGVYSARYATMANLGLAVPEAASGNSPLSRDGANLRKLIHNLGGVPDDKRQARFVCALSFFDPTYVNPASTEKGLGYTATGTFEGTLITEPRGKNGFGYDPIFVPTGQTITLAEMSAEEKNKTSHRARAAEAMASWLFQNWLSLDTP